MKKSLAASLVLALIIPQFALAAWWNPLSWEIFQILPWVQKPEVREPIFVPDDKPKSPTASSTVKKAAPAKTNTTSTTKTTPPASVTTETKASASKSETTNTDTTKTSPSGTTATKAAAVKGCTNLTQTLEVGSTGPEVTALQTFLYFHLKLDLLDTPSSTEEKVITGTFTTATRTLLSMFQDEQKLTVSRIADDETRKQIYKVSCTTQTAPANTTPVVPLIVGGPAPTITSISPSSGPIGTIVTIKGSGFSSDSQVNVSRKIEKFTVASDGNSLTFTIPPSMEGQKTNTGIYSVSVSNKNGVSAEYRTFTVTVTTRIEVTPPSYSWEVPIEKLQKGYTYTWTPVYITVGILSAQVEYFVDWGDGTPSSYAMHEYVQGQMDVSDKHEFQHAYANAGTYNAKFTIKDNFGNSVEKIVPITINP